MTNVTSISRWKHDKSIPMTEKQYEDYIAYYCETGEPKKSNYAGLNRIKNQIYVPMIDKEE